MKPVLSVKHVTVSYRTGFFARKHTILNNVSFVLHPGQLVGLVGNNGTGKSSLIKAVCYLVPTDLGTITYNTQAMGYLPERYTAPGFLTTEQFLWHMGKLHGLANIIIGKKIDELLDLFNLKTFAKTKIETLSKGTAQRLYIAQAVMHSPTLLLLDEPFSGLDKNSKKMLIDYLLLLKQKQTSVLCCTHADDVDFFDSVLTVQEGKVIVQGHKMLTE